MTDNRNMLLAIVLSALVLIGWTFVSDLYFPAATPQTQVVDNGKVKPLPQPTADPGADAPAPIRDRTIVLADSPRVRISTPSVEGSINLKGAQIGRAHV